MFEEGKYLSETDKFAKLYDTKEVKQGVIARAKKQGANVVYAKYIKFKEKFIDRARLGVHKFFAEREQAQINELENEIKVANENGLKQIQINKQSELKYMQEAQQEHLDKIATIENNQQKAQEKIAMMQNIKQQKDEFNRLMKQQRDELNKPMKEQEVATEPSAEVAPEVGESTPEVIETPIVLNNESEPVKVETPVVEVVPEPIMKAPIEDKIEEPPVVMETPIDMTLMDQQVDTVIEQQIKETAENVEQTMEEELKSAENAEQTTNDKVQNTEVPDWMKQIADATQVMNESLQSIIKEYTSNLTKAIVVPMTTKDQQLSEEKQKTANLTATLQNKENEIVGLKNSNSEKDQQLEAEKQQNANLTTTLQNKENEIVGLKASNGEKDKTIESLQASNAEKDGMIATKDAEILQLKNSIQAMSIQFQQIQSMFANFQPPANTNASENGEKTMVKA